MYFVFLCNVCLYVSYAFYINILYLILPFYVSYIFKIAVHFFSYFMYLCFLFLHAFLDFLLYIFSFTCPGRGPVTTQYIIHIL